MLSSRHPTVTQSYMSESDKPTPVWASERAMHGLDRTPATQDNKGPEDSVAFRQHGVVEPRLQESPKTLLHDAQLHDAQRQRDDVTSEIPVQTAAP
jgi:triphosphatase